MDNGNFYSKKGQRKLSPFVGQELLYDYISEQLDAERKKAVEEFLQENREAQLDVQKINNGLTYVAKLSETVVSHALLEKIQTPSSYFQTVQARIRFDEWPVGIKLALEAMVVALGITSVAVLVPWHKIMSIRSHTENVVLTEVARETPRKATEGEAGEMKEQPAAFQDEGVSTKPNIVDETDVTKGTLKKDVAAASATVPAPASTTPVAAAKPTPAPPPTKAPAPEAKKPETSAAAVAAAESQEKEGKHTGFLYRGSILVTNVSAVTPKLVEKLAALGGRKAGEVELGWKKGNGSYFHFTVPEAKYDEMLKVFNQYGQLKIAKEKHERIMPEGILRLIITVDEKKPKAGEKPVDSPETKDNSETSNPEQ